VRYVKGSSTSLAAAIDNLPRAGTQKARILTYLSTVDGATRDEIERDLNLSGNAVRPRVKELQEEGLVEETERTRRTRSGSQATVLVATNSGVDTGSGLESPGASVHSGVEATVLSSPPPPGDSTAGSARPLNPYEAELWAD
jgi:hypothetical protein